jgi:S1-C subfamily serine protease
VAEQAGLQPGEVILSINGDLVERRENLAWTVANASPDKVLMNVRNVSDGKVHTVTAQLPAEPVDTSRPSYLPPVVNGPPPASG